MYRTKEWRISVVYTNDVAKEIKYAKEFRSRYAMFVNHCNINNGDYHVRRQFDREPSRRPLKKLEKFSRKNKQIKKLVCRRMLKKFLSRKKCIATSNADLEQGAIMTVSSLYKRREKKWHSTRSTLNRKSSNRQSQLLMSALKNSKRKPEKVLIMYAVYAIECCRRNQLKTS